MPWFAAADHINTSSSPQHIPLKKTFLLALAKETAYVECGRPSFVIILGDFRLALIMLQAVVGM